MRITVKNRSAKTSIKYLNQIENKTRPNLCQRSVFINYLIISKPNSIIENMECEDVIEEGLTLWMIIRYSKYLVFYMI